MNFFVANSLIVDFHRQVVMSEHNGNYIVVLMNNKLKEETDCQRLNIASFFGSIYMEDSSIDTDEAKTVIPKFCRSHEEIQIMQKNNAIRDLRLKIKNNIPSDKWRSGYLKQFSRSCKYLEI